LCTARTTESKTTEPQDALQVREPHLDALAVTPRLLECFGADERSGNVAGVLVNVAWDFSCSTVT
jgi:hypothetical protein